jgi:tetratricopeptide (TPR) repeat protein
MKFLFLLILVFTSSLYLSAQDITPVQKALDEFKLEHYDSAIEILEHALEADSENAEIYYYLGFLNHYRAYDSRPLQGYDYSYSEKIFDYLKKTIELDPKHGNARYFFGAECSGNAFLAMQNRDPVKLKYFYQLAYEMGAYPLWLLEFGRNMLNSCEQHAILFTGGNVDFDVCSYLQLHENFRQDINLIPISNIDRPWYVEFLKEGLGETISKIDINLTKNQIMDIHPFKWKTTDVEIPISDESRKLYKLEKDFQMFWSVEPDLSSDRNHSKIESEASQKRTYLSPQRAINQKS